ncbi:MAG: MBOAT family protein [Bacteroidia bacterium]|nr:MBOAT family protein [Bacteroidia bacterium]MCF8445915.1 MBOAT family protein [Bacteroidia bacterium]
MLFNSFEFLLFFPGVVLIYFIFPHKFRWIFLLVASYYFYMNWKPVYAVLIFFSTFITWACGLLVEKAKSKTRKKTFLVLSLLINFSILFIYKYFNFLNESIYSVLEAMNIRWTVPNLDLLLPVGISFYTFQAVGYTIDVYRGDLKPEKNLGMYALFVSFFPQLVAGPIERTQNLLPQFRVVHYFDFQRLESGIKQMIWGFFMKVVIADRVSLIVNAAYNNTESHNGTTFLIASIFFAFQIYCDFAGYSNIAIGAARIMGFDLMTNFKRPYLATNITEFWRRWHISLSTWFRDYLYIPLGGNRVSESRNVFNVFITFVLSGIWHGANWTFFIWGFLHGLYNSVQKALGLDKWKFENKVFLKSIMILVNFFLVSIAWVFFRANNTSDAFLIITKIFTDFGVPFIDPPTLLFGLFGLAILLIKEISEEYFPNSNLFLESSNPFISSITSALLIIIILSIGVFDGGQFIYFQF